MNFNFQPQNSLLFTISEVFQFSEMSFAVLRFLKETTYYFVISLRQFVKCLRLLFYQAQLIWKTDWLI